MISLKHLLLILACQVTLTGCGVNVDVPQDPSTDTPVSALSVSGLTDSQTIDTNYCNITVTDPQNKYETYQYAIDSEKAYSSGTINIPTTVTVSTEGSHILFVRGVYSSGTTEGAIKINFTVKSLQRVADGKYFGDVMVSYANYSGMRVSFADYSGSRAASNVTGKLSTADSRKFSVSGVSIDNQQVPADVELLMTTTSSPESFRTYGEGYYQYLNLKYLGVDSFNTAVSGDMRLYRCDIKDTLVASCTSMLVYNQTGLPELQANLMLYSYDNRYFYGHVRLINPSLIKVLTYDVKGETGPDGLSGNNGGMKLTLSKGSGYVLKPLPSSAVNGTGYLTVSSDAKGKYKVNQLSLNLTGYAIYDSAPDSITMIKSYPIR
jgi:hypothetical protein